MKEPLAGVDALRDDVSHTRAPLVIGHSGEVPAWFVQHQINVFFAGDDAFPVNVDDRVSRINFDSLLPYNLAVHLYTAGGNELFRDAA